MKKPNLHIPDFIEMTMRSDKLGLAKDWLKRCDWIIQRRPIARRFIFDTEASIHVGHFIRDCGDIILANRQFALPPFETSYLQFDSRALINAIGRRNSNEYWGADSADLELGFLIHKDTVQPMSTAPAKAGVGTRAGPTFFRYHFGPVPSGPIFDKPLNPFDPEDEWVRMAVLLGSTAHELEEKFDDETRLDIIRSVRIDPVALTGPDNNPRTWKKLCYSCFGDIRILWAALLLLNQKRDVVLETVPWSKGIYKGKRQVYATHNIVRIKLGSQQPVRKLVVPEWHVPRRRHDVRAHYAHFHCSDYCAHQWPILPEIELDGIPRWQCERCKGLRVRRKAHVRGHGGVGVVTKEYAVTKDPDE